MAESTFLKGICGMNKKEITLNNQQFQLDSCWTQFKYNCFVRFFAFMKIPLLWSLKPSILRVDKNHVVIKIPLRRFSKNHLNSMYFGALSAGADLVVGTKVVFRIFRSKERVDFAFKDFKAQFLKRAEDDVYFVCNEGEAIDALIDKTLQTGERESQTFSGYAVVPNINPNEKVMTFALTLSVRCRKSEAIKS